MAGHRQAGADARQGTGVAGAVVLHQLVGPDGVPFGVAIAGDDQVVGEGAYAFVHPGDQWPALPFQQALVEAAHTLPAPAGKQQDRAGRQRHVGHGTVSGAGL
ncbi:hypothetical protein D3C72_2114540 [compost metagenome]